MGRVQGKVCIVTGGAMGLGWADARALRAEGATVVITDRDAIRGRAAAAELAVDFFEHDVTDECQWQALIDWTVQQFGRLDVLVNNAGIVLLGSIEEATFEQWRRVNAVSADGTFLGCKYAYAAMKQHGGGSIINMSSTAALVGIPSIVAYSAAKGAIRSLTKSVAIHAATHGHRIRCNSIHPGNMNTPMLQNTLDQIFDGIPKQDRPPLPAAGDASEVAAMVVYLASDESRSVNGAEMVIDRGITVMEGQLH